MDSIPKNSILEFNSDTVQYVKSLYGLDNKERLEDAINIIKEWIQKQDHLLKKDLSNEHLERLIIFNKGSVEKAKLKYDKICTFRTLLQDYFEPFDEKNLENLYLSFLPKMTKDHYRVFILKNTGQRFTVSFFDCFKCTIKICEYTQAHDYCNGIVVILDYLECKMQELIKNINLVELRNTISIITDGYGMRIKELHVLSTSKAIDVLITIFKQVLSLKIAQRIHVHKNVDKLYEYLPRDILPVDYGGEEKSIQNLSKDLMDELNSDKFNTYFDAMTQARTNEAYRSEEKFNNEYMGVAGSFKKLSVD